MLEKLVDKLMKFGAAAAEAQARKAMAQEAAKANATAGGGVGKFTPDGSGESGQDAQNGGAAFPKTADGTASVQQQDVRTPISIVCERIVIKPGVPGANGIAMDGTWHEEQHRRADNGRFTSGGGRGKRKDREGGRAQRDHLKLDGGGRKDRRGYWDDGEMRAEIEGAFKKAGGEDCVKKVEKGEGELNFVATIKAGWPGETFGLCHKVNKILEKHGAKAKVENPKEFTRVTIGRV